MADRRLGVAAREHGRRCSRAVTSISRDDISDQWKGRPPGGGPSLVGSVARLLDRSGTYGKQVGAVHRLHRGRTGAPAGDVRRAFGAEARPRYLGIAVPVAGGVVVVVAGGVPRPKKPRR